MEVEKGRRWRVEATVGSANYVSRPYHVINVVPCSRPLRPGIKPTPSASQLSPIAAGI